MKSLKIALASVTFVVAVIVLSSFAVSKYDNSAFARVCYEYVGPNPATPTVSQLQDTNNWAPIVPAPSETEIDQQLCVQSSKLCIVCFDDANTSLNDAIGLLVSYVSGGGTIGALPDPATRTSGTKSVKIFQFN